MKKVLVVVGLVAVLGAVMAATTLNTVITLNFACDYNKVGDLNTSQDDVSLAAGQTLTNGTGANQANVLWKDTRTLTGSADVNETLDLYDGSLTNGFGDQVLMTKLKMIFIHNKSTDANCLVGAAGSTPLPLFGDAASDILKIRAGGKALLIAPDASGYAVTATPHLKIKRDATTGTTLTYDIIIAGVQ
jgi:hypothetical protein